MKELEKQIDSIEELLEERQEKQVEIDQLRQERKRTYGQQREMVVSGLYSLQNSLEDDESVVLIDAEEWSRGGHYNFNEVLTPEGVVAQDVERVFVGGNAMVYDQETGNLTSAEESDSSDEYEIRDGNQYRDASPGELYGWQSDSEPLDIEEEYITGRRDRPKFVDRLSERLTAFANGENHIPQNGFGYD